MHAIALALSLAGGLIALVAAVDALAARFRLPAPTLLLVVGSAIGAAHLALGTLSPGAEGGLFAPLIAPSFPAEAYLWVFLPPLLFRTALTVDVHSMIPDWAPILLLAVVGVGVSTAIVGWSVAMAGGLDLVACLVLGAIVATTDPTAVFAAFRKVCAPARLITLVEGESLLNDAAAIAIVGVLLAMLGGDAAAATLGAGLETLAISLAGGLMARAKQLPRVRRYSLEFKLSAVRLSKLPGVQVQQVARALDIHPFMLSRWRKQVCEGALRAKAPKFELSLECRGRIGELAAVSSAAREGSRRLLGTSPRLNDCRASSSYGVSQECLPLVL
jgi:transposase-like protein